MKNELIHFLKQESKLLFKYGIVTVSVLITILYIGIFTTLNFQEMIYGKQLLVAVILSDPGILGFLFTGVMVLFEKNENTFQALSVVPFKIKNYLLARSIALSFISMICSLLMLYASGLQIHSVLWFCFAVFTCAMMFSFIGFAVVAKHRVFNTYFIRAIGVVMLISMPIFAYFEILPSYWFVLFPSQASIWMFDISLSNDWSVFHSVLVLVLNSLWVFLTYKLAYKAIKKSFDQA